MKPYNHNKIEKKWQKYWDSKKFNKVKEDKKKKKFFALIEFPYPSGDGLHVGHIRSNTAMDIIARKRRMEGYNVLYPIGWDAFGLPTENYAIKTGIQPAIVTKKNTDTFRKQLKALGFSFDWSREINTTDPKYYKWTQWIFLQFLKKDLAYKKKMTINWCPKDLIGLANEEVIDGCCERCGTPVEKREKEQWMLAITKYADRLDKDLNDTEFQEKIKIQQRNWIGKSEGAEIDFCIKNNNKKIKVFTTRPDTLFGVTYIVLAPENSLIKELINSISNKNEVEKYIKDVKNKTDIERTDTKSDKTGIELKGIKAINPANNEEVPIWIADYVLADYGTGAVMAVPAHDERDYEFAKKYNLNIKQVIARYIIDKKYPPAKGQNQVSRRTIHAIVRNPKTNKYLCLEWKKFPWTTFIVGGVEGNEDIVDAAKREIYEETGFKNLKLIKKLENIVCAEYNAAHKKENRLAYTTGIFFELINEERDEVNEEEKEKHEYIWLDKKDITEERMTCAELPVWLENFDNKEKVYLDNGILINSGEFNNKKSENIKKEITKTVGGNWVTKFKLRDWIFSRQRYWGEPIPVVHCEKCGIVPVPEKELPIKLPKVKNYKPTENGESPLASINKWVNTKCPKCKGKAKRETDTMPNWAGSSWYYLRYTDPKNNKAFSDKNNLKYWTPVDWYNGGMEHTTLHLLYSRFWHKFLYDLKLVPTNEPYKKRTSHGLILAQNGEKMSKSKGNVINPDSIVNNVGADSLRLYEMFMGPFAEPIAWDTNNIAGVRRFIEKVWRLQDKVGKADKEVFLEGRSLSERSLSKTDVASSAGLPINTSVSAIETLIHKTIKKVSEDIEDMKFNTAISSLMILVNELDKQESISKENYEILIKLISPFVPHIGEELWSILGNKKSITLSKWPIYDKTKIVENTITIVIQINGKVRSSFVTNINESDENVKKMALDMDEIKKWTDGKDIKKVIFIKGKLVNIVL